MPKIDPYQSWGPLEARLATETSQRARTLIKEVRDHMEYEIKGQLEPLMSTLTAEPIYHFWGQGMVLEGREAVAGFYGGMIAAGGNQFEVVVDNIIADDNRVVTEGQVKQVYTGKELKGMGMTELLDTTINDADLFMTTTQLITVWPGAADDKLLGEDIYFGGDPFANVEKITADDLPDYYRWEDRV
jgi:hypothetical protein